MAICDSVLVRRKQVKKIIDAALFSLIEFKTWEFNGGKEIYEAVSKGNFLADLIIIDTALSDVNVLALTEAIKKISKTTEIIFWADSDRYVFDGYKYRIFDYILQNDSNAMSQALQRCCSEKISSKTDYLSIKSHGCLQHIRLDGIDFFESRGRKIAAISVQEELEFYFKMDELVQILPQNKFFRCHQSYIVNKSHITSSNAHEIIIKHFSIPISRKYLQEVRTILQDTSFIS